ncbi:superoxide dismutase family protein [Aurantiacibacter xanthus]|uniref:Superoxide dismutase family protein n=1 Tax=Aurantiacibacter xanthus TaxID=1784712 RepID=A0A3A1P614_9SPHN|nr:superoxide dismutase family protein [Aurantiacibacter xanthus]RIV83002.1 superoxide dismutase family protein [Aurantiacibacter xanthus]
MRKFALPLLALGAATLAACGGNDADETVIDDVAATDGAAAGAGETATAALKTADGEEVGTVTATGSAGGITIDVSAMNMPEGLHGVHVHTVGSCEDGFAAAGGHWNPAEAKHGLEAADGQHAGDMPNLEIGADGTGSLTYMLAPSATFAGLMDEDGSAFIVHAGEDDQTTDPSGDSGDRIACGVFTAG